MNTKPKTILVVDDDEGMRDTLTAILKRDYLVLTAATGEEGLAIIQREEVNLMLLDVRLPGINGLELLRIVKESYSLIEVIMVSALSEVEVAVTAMKRGAYHYITKEFDYDGLRSLVRNALERQDLSCLGAQLAISVNNCPPPRDPRSRMTSFKRTQRKYVQKAYRVRNWREYETGLRARGSLTVWLGLTDGKLANWNSPRPTRRKPGRQRKYSNHAIETTVTLGLVFGLASRQTEGFLRSLLTLLNLDNDVPDHSTISRRKARLGKVASYERRTVKPVHLLIDSSGLSVHVGQLRTPPKARDYRKLHLAVDEHTSDVVACELTSKRARDASRVASLVGQIERPIASAKADAAYDTGDVYKTLENHRAHRSPKVLIPPRKGAQLALDSAGTRQRNRNIRARSRVGKRKWYVASGYSRRSKVETTFHRYKAILGSAMRARGLASQRVEVRLGCKILNTMTALGIPDGEMIG